MLLLSVTETNLQWWNDWAELYDTYGLPIDLIWCRLRDDNLLPEVNGARLSSDDFETGVRQMVDIRQVGGHEAVYRYLLNRIKIV